MSSGGGGGGGDHPITVQRLQVVATATRCTGRARRAVFVVLVQRVPTQGREDERKDAREVRERVRKEGKKERRKEGKKERRN